MREVETIAAGLKQALIKGESLEKASRSFINSGYSSIAVNKATVITRGAQIKSRRIEVPKPQTKAKQGGKTYKSILKFNLIAIGIAAVIEIGIAVFILLTNPGITLTDLLSF